MKLLQIAVTKIKDKLQNKPAKRSSKWPKVRSEHLKKNPECAVCGGTSKLEVHHIIPIHIDSTLELYAGNLITLCESKKYGINCHLAVGHLGDYAERFNLVVNDDAKCIRKRIDPLHYFLLNTSR